MRIDARRCPLVMVGAWNTAIFTPPFVGRVAMPGPEVPTLAMRVFPGGIAFEFTGPNFVLVVMNDRTIFRPHNLDDATLQAVETAADTLLGQLPLTPLAGMGINFGFDEPWDAGSPLARLLESTDADLLNGAGASIRGTTVRRELELGGRVVNLTVARQADEVVKVDLNFHTDIATAEQARPLRGAITARKADAVVFLGRVYGLTLP